MKFNLQRLLSILVIFCFAITWNFILRLERKTFEGVELQTYENLTLSLSLRDFGSYGDQAEAVLSNLTYKVFTFSIASNSKHREFHNSKWSNREINPQDQP